MQHAIYCGFRACQAGTTEADLEWPISEDYKPDWRTAAVEHHDGASVWAETSDIIIEVLEQTRHHICATSVLLQQEFSFVLEY